MTERETVDEFVEQFHTSHTVMKNGEQTDLFYCWELPIIRLQVNTYFEQAGEAGLTKTHGRSPVATLNKMIEYLGFLPIVMNSVGSSLPRS